MKIKYHQPKDGPIRLRMDLSVHEAEFLMGLSDFPEWIRQPEEIADFCNKLYSELSSLEISDHRTLEFVDHTTAYEGDWVHED